MEDSARFCSGCGAQSGLFEAAGNRAPVSTHPRVAAAKGVGQLFGLDPRITFLAFILDLMLFGGEAITFGISESASILVGAVFGFITYRAQMKWYGDDHESALIKGCILGLLTAIPTPLPALLYVPSGIVGLVHNMFGKKNRKLTTATS